MSLDQDTAKANQERLDNDEKQAKMYSDIVLGLGNVDLYDVLGVPEFDVMTDDIRKHLSDGYFVNSVFAENTEKKNNTELAYIILNNPILKAQYDFTTFAHSMKTFKPSSNYRSA